MPATIPLERVIPIEQPDDERLEPYRMVRERDLAGRRGLFIAEGKVVLDALLQRGRHPLASVLVSRSRLEPDAELLARVPEQVPLYSLDPALMEQVAGFPIHRGLLAAGHRLPPVPAGELLGRLAPGPATVLLLEGLTNHDNTGACFRNAAAFGVDALLLDGTCADPLYRKSIRVSAGHALTLPFSHGQSSGELLDALQEAGFFTVALGLGKGAVELRSGCPRPAERLALLLGSEGPGLSRRVLGRVQQYLRIPMAPGVDSLNVATAAAVALFALRGA